jgi:hypothetical protein
MSDVDVIVPFWESDERELDFDGQRPSCAGRSSQSVLTAGSHFSGRFESPMEPFDRVEVAVSSTGPVNGHLSVALYSTPTSFSPAVVLRQPVRTTGASNFEIVSLPASAAWAGASLERMEIAFEPSDASDAFLVLHTLLNDHETPLMRFFRRAPGHCRRGIDRCLASLHRAGVDGDAIHVIDKRQSSAMNRNEAFRECTKPWICFMDDDAELGDATTLQQLLTAMHDTGAGLCGPKLLTPAGLIYSGIPFTDPVSMEARVAGLRDEDRGQHDAVAIVPWLPSTVLMVHRSVMLTTGGFDERYAGSQHEDADFSLRARARGFRCCYNGRAVATHYNQLRNGHFARNVDYFNRRWRDRRDLFTPPVRWRPTPH